MTRSHATFEDPLTLLKGKVAISAKRGYVQWIRTLMKWSQLLNYSHFISVHQTIRVVSLRLSKKTVSPVQGFGHTSLA